MPGNDVIPIIPGVIPMHSMSPTDDKSHPKIFCTHKKKKTQTLTNYQNNHLRKSTHFPSVPFR